MSNLKNKNSRVLGNISKESGSNLSKALLCFVVYAVLALVFVNCPSSGVNGGDTGNGGSGNGGGNGNGGGTDPTVPSAFTLTGAAGTVTNSAPRATITLSWTNPSEAELTVTLTVTLSGNPTGSTLTPAIDSSSGAQNNVTVSGLAAETEYTLTVTATNSAGTANASATATTPELPVVLWSLGAQNGDFGFAACQTRLTGGASATSGIERGLYAAGYRTGRFAGSTPDYNWTAVAPNPGIDTDPDALGDVASRNIVTTTDGTAFTNTFTDSDSEFTMSQIAVVWSSTSNPNVAIVIGSASSSEGIWFFSTPSGIYDGDSTSCLGATSNANANTGNGASVHPSTTPATADVGLRCDNIATSALCIAK